jgi:transcriptional regulator with XRE-family HTH domain
MTQRNQLSQAPPFAIEQTLGTLGANLKTARIRRRLTIAEVAEKIGTGTRPVSDAESGKPTTAASVYIALLWVYGLLDDMQEVGSPLNDVEGLRLAELRQPQRARARRTDMNNDF